MQDKPAKITNVYKNAHRIERILFRTGFVQ